MSKHQRSFFDQDTKYRLTRRPWIQNASPRGSTGHNLYKAPRSDATGIRSKTPIAASSQSRTKLQAFRYRASMAPIIARPIAIENDLDKENIKPVDEDTISSQMQPPLLISSQKSTGKDTRDCPQTPMGRLPLSQLLANSDDSRKADHSPLERVLWDNSPNSVNPTSSNASKKKRKRAHSISPLSSSQDGNNRAYDRATAVADYRSLQQAFKTPKGNPADDLWSRYSVNTEKASPCRPHALSHIHLHSSSPQTPGSAMHTRDNSLRRAISCIEWPTSAAKRRKLRYDGFSRETAADFHEVTGSNQKAKMSRVSLLVDQVQLDLHRVRRATRQPSSEHVKITGHVPRSSSAMINKSRCEISCVIEPHEKVSDAIDFDDFENGNVQEVVSLPRTSPLRIEGEPPSSDFGDDDFDVDLFVVEGRTEHQSDIDHGSIDNNALRTEIGSAQVPHHPDSGLSETRIERQLLEHDKNKKQPSISLSPHRQPMVDYVTKDEFDDEDEDNDAFACMLEDVMTRHEAISPSKSTKVMQQAILNKDVHNAPMLQNIEVVSDDEDFGGDSDFEQVAAECEQGTDERDDSITNVNDTCRTASTIQRYKVLAVATTDDKSDNGDGPNEKVLSVICERTKRHRAVVLRQAWLDTPCLSGSYVNVIGDFDRFGQCIIDNAQNLLILHPDHLVSSTVVGDSFTCTRKAVLQDRVKATTSANQATVYGHILHEIFQEALRANRWDDDFMFATIEGITARYLETLFEITIDHNVAIEQLKTRVVDLQAWAEIFIAADPKSNAIVKDRNGAESIMAINKLLEVEEHIWSPLYGLKGNVDATVQITIEADNVRKTLTAPLELKTGKHLSAAHKAQTALYSLLLSDRYDINIACGILYYMQTSDISSIRTLRHELVPMIVQRNALANFVREREALPDMLKKAYTCGKCYAQTPCFIYHKLIDDGNGETSGMGEKFEEQVKHLSSNHQAFFRKWDGLLTKEEKDVTKLRRELWTMHSDEREKVGRCFGRLVIDPLSERIEDGAAKINRYQYTLSKHCPRPEFTFVESQITMGEPIVLSDENGHYALANGYVTKVRTKTIEIAVDRRLHDVRRREKTFNAEDNQAFKGIMRVRKDSGDKPSQCLEEVSGPMLYRLDKDEFSNGMALIRNNLIRLMERDVFGVQSLRNLIVDGKAPTFKEELADNSLARLTGETDLNPDQQAAIRKVMSARDYALVLGMPGTGKTTTIAQIIRALVLRGKSVLLTSYTHTAVDNILLKLKDDDLGIFRLGALAKVHPEVQKFADLAGKPIKTKEDLEMCYERAIVATTCLGINHPIFNQRIFDYCIVDEASQITLPVCLGPIRMARTFILVGDHYQLPPLVQNKEACDGGLDVSLFKMLSDTHPSSVVNLEHQYRMCEDIMTLSSTLIYDGRLKCGTEAVAQRYCRISHMDALKQHHHTASSLLTQRPASVCAGPTRQTCWLRDLLDPSVKACFVNTDSLLPQSREYLEQGSRITNPCESVLTIQLVESLLTVGIAPNDIGVITLYRSQLALLKQGLRHRPNIEMHTADKYQGRDKEVIILSLVRSNEQKVIGDLLKDWRRVNVALTRARTKLLILGSKSTIQGNELLKDFITLMENKAWLYNLPTGACEGHVFEEAATQLTEFGSAELKTESGSSSKRLPLPGNVSSYGARALPKQGKLDMAALLRHRPVLQDIVNDAA